jgi:hypothetical protein
MACNTHSLQSHSISLSLRRREAFLHNLSPSHLSSKGAEKLNRGKNKRWKIRHKNSSASNYCCLSFRFISRRVHTKWILLNFNRDITINTEHFLHHSMPKRGGRKSAKEYPQNLRLHEKSSWNIQAFCNYIYFCLCSSIT